MLPKKAIKIICIILAGLMILSAVSALVSVFAVDEQAIINAVTTGDNDMDYILPIVIIALALVAIVVCLVLPKLHARRG